MSQQKLTIVPVTLYRENQISSTYTSPENYSNNVCTINAANIEISFSNGVDEHIIQTVMRELKNL